MQLKHFIAIAIFLILLSFESFSAYAAPIKVYLDESRSMQLGAQVWFSARGSQPMRLSRVTDLIDYANLKKYDVMIVWNQVECISYSQDELDAVKTFVDSGGGLLIIGTPSPHTLILAKFNKGIFPNPIALPTTDYSLNALTGLFGPVFSNASRPGSPKFSAEHQLTDVPAIEQVSFEQPLSCLVGNFKKADQIASAYGHPIIVAISKGKGRVVICGASRLFMKYGKLPDRKLHKNDDIITAQEDLLLHWLDWLSANSPIRGQESAKLPHRIPGRIRLTESGLLIYTIPQLEPKARELVEDWKKVWSELSRVTGLSSPVELVRETTENTPLEVYLCASPAGGLSAANRIAISAMGGDERLIGVLSHEVGHKLLGGCNTSVSEAFAEWLSIKGLMAAGFEEKAKAKLAEKLKAFHDVDPSGKVLDINNTTSDITQSPACQGKWIWILSTLEKEHGDTFLKDYLQSLRQQINLSNPARKRVNGNVQRLSMRDHVNAMSAAAGKDLSSWFTSLGITLE